MERDDVRASEEENAHNSLLREHTVQPKQRHCPKVRKIGSKGAVLVIVWTLLVFSFTINPVYSNTIFSHQIDISIVSSGTFILALSVVILISPLVGLLASIYYGRYNTVRAGLWLMWVGNAITVPMFIIQWIFPDIHQTLSYSGFLIAAGIFCFGFTLYMVNSVPFGLDQMPFASGEEISAFIRWYVWSLFTGVCTGMFGILAFKLTSLSKPDRIIILSFVPLVLISVTLCSSFLLNGWLTIEPTGTNPLKTVFKVLKFAVKHKRPIRRSAFTYCETVKPSRLDFGKTKYGGPFTNEEVEDVKTFLRMSVVIVSFGVAVLAVCVLALPLHEALSVEFTVSFTGFNQVAELSSFVIVLAIPVFELLIYPLINKWIPTSLKRASFAPFLTIGACLIMLVCSTLWYMLNDPTKCIFTSQGASTTFPVDRNWIEVPCRLLLYSFGILAVTAILEFVCAQAPYTLKGLLVGVLYAVVLSNIALSVGIYLVWRTAYQEWGPDSPSCGVWFYLFTTILATLGCVLWCAVAKWYKNRERDEPELCRLFAENYYAQ